MAVRVRTDVGHEDLVDRRHHVDELEIADALAVRPATLEIRLSIESVVERTGEVEVLGDERLDCRAVLLDVRGVDGAHDGDRVMGHGEAPSIPTLPQHLRLRDRPERPATTDSS